MHKLKFEAIIEKSGNSDAAFVRFPYHTEELIGTTAG